MVNVVSFSEAGGHPANEDAYDVRQHPSDPACWLCFLADGQGGRAGGGQAAQIACNAAAEAALRQQPRKLAGLATWDAIFREADEMVCAAPGAGFTTLLGFCLAGGTLVGASSGDSAVLVVSEGEPPKELTAGQVKNPPVGSGAALFVAFAARLAGAWLAL